MCADEALVAKLEPLDDDMELDEDEEVPRRWFTLLSTMFAGNVAIDYLFLHALFLLILFPCSRGDSYWRPHTTSDRAYYRCQGTFPDDSVCHY